MTTLQDFEDTTARKCRWSEYAGELFLYEQGWRVVWDVSEADYSGMVKLIAVNISTGAWRTLEYSYGSCAGCDAWEDLSPEIMPEEMRKCTMDFQSGAEMMRFLESVRENWLGESFRAATPAVAEYLNRESEVPT